jgi:hypothetical protein
VVKSNKMALVLITIIAILSGMTTEEEVTACCKALSADPETYLCPDRAFALMFPRPVPEHSVLFTVEHRGRSPAFKYPMRDGLGYDNGSLKIGLGLRYSPLSKFDVGVRRVNNGLDQFDTYEFDGRVILLDEQRRNIDAALGAGVSLFYQDKDGIASGYFTTILIGRSIGERVYVSAGALYHSNSTFSTKTTDDINASLCIPVSISARIISGFSIINEWFLPEYGFSGGTPAWAFGFKYATWKHSFSLLLTNTQYTTMDGVVCGSDRLNNPVLGFMIVRKFGGE